MVSTECSGQLPCQFLELCETPLRFLPSYILKGSIEYFSKCFLLIFLFFTRDFRDREKILKSFVFLFWLLYSCFEYQDQTWNFYENYLISCLMFACFGLLGLLTKCAALSLFCPFVLYIVLQKLHKINYTMKNVFICLLLFSIYYYHHFYCVFPLTIVVLTSFLFRRPTFFVWYQILMMPYYVILPKARMVL